MVYLLCFLLTNFHDKDFRKIILKNYIEHCVFNIMNLYVKNCPRSFLDYIFHVSCAEKLSSAKFFRKSYLVKLYFYKLMNLCPVADAEFQLRGGLVLPLPYLHSFLHLFFLFFSHISPLISMEVLGSSRGARAPLGPPLNPPLCRHAVAKK